MHPGGNPTYVGAIKGSFSIAPHGGAMYSVDIQAPPGVAGMQPQLSLAYSSVVTTGMVGVGWTLRGLSSITRVGRNPAQDGVAHKDGVHYDSRDRFLLDGSRLVVVAGTYGAAHSVYHTEIESWRQVTASPGGTQGNPTGFVSLSSDGRCFEYGGTPDSQFRASGPDSAVREWALSRVVDAHGNFMTIEYRRDPSTTASYPARIAYTGNASKGATLTPQRAVEFIYEPRPDVQPRYEAGCPVHETLRLRQVRTSVDGKTAATYTLDYGCGTASGRSRLEALTLADATGRAFPPTRFDWLDLSTLEFSAPKRLTDPQASPGEELIPLDVDGSGRRDLLAAGADDDGHLILKLMIATETGDYLPPRAQAFPALTFSPGCLLALDLDGDGATELVHRGRDGDDLSLTLLRARKTDGAWRFEAGEVGAAGPKTLPARCRLMSLDADGDGKVDLVCAWPDDNGQMVLQALLSTGEDFRIGGRTDTGLPFAAGVRLLAVDFDGDGMTDLLYAAEEEHDGGRWLALRVLLSDGASFKLQPGSPLPSATRLPFGGALMAARLKDDDHDDLIYATSTDDHRLVVHVLLGTGVDYRLTEAGPVRTDLRYTGWVFPMAMRGAGLLELAVATRDDAGLVDLSLMRWNGISFDPPAPCAPELRGLAGGGRFIPADVAGHGKSDLLYFPPRDDGKADMVVCGAPPEIPDRVRRIIDGLGASVEVSYLPLTDSRVYSKDDAPHEAPASKTVDGQSLLNASISGSAWPMSPGASLASGTQGSTYALRSRQFAEYVVSAHSTSDGRGAKSLQTHRYRGCRIDTAGRGWLGFSVHETSVHERGVTVTDRYNQEFPISFTVASKTTRRDADGALIERQQTLYAVTTPKAEGDPGVYRADVSRVVTERFTMGETRPDVTETEEYRHDAFGNATFYAKQTTNGAPIYTTCAYDNDVKGWRLGQLRRRTLAADAGGERILAQEETDYDRVSGKVVESRAWDDVNRRFLATRRTYDPWGNEISVTDPSGAITRIEFDTKYRTFPIRRISPAGGSGFAATTTATYDAASGAEQSRTDANGVTIRYALDGFGRPVEAHGPDPAGVETLMEKVSWGSDANGSYTERRRRADWKADAWTAERDYFDSEGKIYRKVVGDSIVERRHNGLGQVVGESLPRREGETPLWVTTEYDAVGRVVRRTEPTDGGGVREIRTRYPSTDRAITLESSGGVRRSSTYDYASYGGERLLVGVTDAVGNISRYAYDAAGRSIQATDPAGVTTTSRYDTLGRRIDMRVAKGDKTFSSERVAHDDEARAVRVTTAAGNVIQLHHDALNRLQRRIVTLAGGATEETLYVYDRADGFARGRLAAVTTPHGGVYRYSYDALGNLTEQTATIGSHVYPMRYAYTPSGRLDQVRFPDGAITRHEYNPLGQLSALRLVENDGLTHEIATFGRFSAAGRAQDVAYGNGLRETRTYNPLGQLKSQMLGPHDAPLEHTELEWSVFHQLRRITDRVAPLGTQVFDYDPTGRLARAERNPDASGSERVVQTFAYDPGGNLTEKNGVTFTYDGHQLCRGVDKEGAEVFAASYDPDGAMRRATRNGRKANYEYDGLGRLAASGETRFQYDHTGRRVLKASSVATTHYVTRDYEVTLFPDGSAQSTKYIHGAEGVVAQVTRRLRPPTTGAAEHDVARRDDATSGALAGIPELGICYFHTNLINSSTIVTDAAGLVSARVDYEPFGEIRTISGRDTFRPKFTAKEFDRETGLYYFNARYYDPAVGHFTTADDRLGGDFGAPDSLNRYAYVLNNPITGVDIDGHFRWDIFLDVVLTVAAVTLMVAATVVTGGAAGGLALAGSIALGAASSGIAYSATTADGDLSVGQYWAEVGLGAVSGALTGIPTGAGAVATARIAGWVAQRVALQSFRAITVNATKFALTTLTGVVSGALSGFIGNGIRNCIKSESFMDGASAAAASGAWRGAITGAMTYGASLGKSQISLWAEAHPTAASRLASGLVSTALGFGAGGAFMLGASIIGELESTSGSGRQQPLQFTNLGLA
jgi:RHS repeat-associated protein